MEGNAIQLAVKESQHEVVALLFSSGLSPFLAL